MLSWKKCIVIKSRNTGICGILRQDVKCERLDSIPVRVTITLPRKSSLQKDLRGLHIHPKHHLFVVCSLFSKNLLSSRKSTSFRLFVFAEIQRVRHSVGHLSLRLLKHMTIYVACIPHPKRAHNNKV